VGTGGRAPAQCEQLLPASPDWGWLRNEFLQIKPRHEELRKRHARRGRRLAKAEPALTD